MYSKSVHELRKSVDGLKIIKTEDSVYRHNPGRLIINWGSNAATLTEHQRSGPVINPTAAVKICANKQRFFEAVSAAARVPDFTTSGDVALDWANNGSLVVARTKLNGHSGEGILFSDEDPEFYKKGLLFTKYVPKLSEFRVHIFQNDILDVQQKKLRTHEDDGKLIDKEQVNWRVRSFVNGFIFAREDIHVPEDVLRQAKHAFNSLKNLDFGAFDIIYNRKEDKAYVLECNTAPGLVGTTLDKYAEKIRELRV